jgi:integrase/recombinase XerC
VQPSQVCRYLEKLATQRGCSALTLRSYRSDLGILAALAARGSSPDPDWTSLSEHELRRWVAAESRAGRSPRSIARRLSAWRGFYDWLAEQGQADCNPARGVRAPRPARRLPKALSPDQTLSLLEAGEPEPDALEAIRDKAMLELFYSCGLRLSELGSLDVHYFDGISSSWYSVGESEVTVTGKGGRRRSVPVGSHARRALEQWIAVRQKWLATKPLADSRPLFISRHGSRLANRTMQARLKRLAIERGIPANLHPHVLRHSFASHLLQSSGDLRAVQELLGHASIATTQIYTSLDFQRLAAVYDAAHPRARKRQASSE